MAGAHTSEKRWYRNQNPNGGESVADQVSTGVTGVITSLEASENMFAEMLELYTFTGSTMQGLADQLFLEKWQARSAVGVQTQLTFDVAGNVVTAVTIVQAGTGYVDGTGYTLTVEGGNLDAVVSYDVVGGALTNAAVDAAGTGYIDGVGQVMINEPAPGVVFETEANATELGMTQDAFDAVTATHELYQAMTNVIVAQEDRLAQLRRMS